MGFMAKKIGRPPRFKAPEDLKNKIEAYFNSCWVDKIAESKDAEGNITTANVTYQNRPYTVAGLALELGFVSRQSFYDYSCKKEFSYIIKRARLKIEMNVEEIVIAGKNGAGPIFWLKANAGYRDHEDGSDPAQPTPVSVTIQVEDATS